MPTLEAEECGCKYVDNGMYYVLRSPCSEHKEGRHEPDQVSRESELE